MGLTSPRPRRGPSPRRRGSGPHSDVPSEADFANVDFDALDISSDYTRFMQPGVPDAIRQKALRKLWASDPVLAMPDLLNDYMGDYTDAALAVSPDLLRTAYRVGRGFLDDSEVAAREELGRPAAAVSTADEAARAKAPSPAEADRDLPRREQREEDGPAAPPEEADAGAAEKDAPGETARAARRPPGRLVVRRRSPV